MRPARAIRFAVLLLFCALALGLHARHRLRKPDYLMVVDESPSVRERLPGYSSVAAVSWGKFSGGRHPTITVDAREGRGTDLAAAIEGAAALRPADREKRILLVSDGLGDPDRLARTADVLREIGVKVYALDPPPVALRAALVEVAVPERAFLWEPFSLSGVFVASRSGPVTVELSRNGAVVDTQTATPGPEGYGSVTFTQEGDRVGTIAFEMRVQGGSAPPLAAAVRIAESPRVRYLTTDPLPSQGLVTLFREAGVEIVVTDPDDLVAPASELSADDVIVLDDIPAAALRSDILDAVQGAVGLEGKGLLVIGGRKGLGSEELRGSDLEKMLPATAGYTAPPPPAAISLVIVLDTSFSMYFYPRGERRLAGQGPKKYEVANESVKEVVRALRPGDKIGILGNSTDLFWAAPLGEVRDPAALLERIDHILPAGGGLNFYSAVNEAYRALRSDNAPVRHVLVFGDAEDIDEHEVTGLGHTFELVRQMAAEGITLSVLALGRSSDKDAPFLRTATLLGGGDFYLVSRLRALPRYFVAEYRKLANRFYLDEPLSVLLGDYTPLVASVGGGFPPLAGTATLTARTGSQTPLLTSAGVPLLVLGVYGRGRTAVFAGDNGQRWAPDWLTWQGAGPFWLRLLSEITPKDRVGQTLSAQMRADSGRDALAFTILPARERFPPWDHLIAVEEGSGMARRFNRTGLRTYRSAEPLPPPGNYHFRLASADSPASAITRVPVFVPGSPEDLPLPPAWPALDALVGATGGAWVSSPEAMTAGAFPFEISDARLRLLLVLVGLALLAVEALINHRPWR